MLSKLRLVAVATVAAGVLAVVTGSAGAYVAFVEPAGAISAASEGKVRFRSALATVECNLTLNGSLSAGPNGLTRGSQYGSITEIRKANCTGGELLGVLGLPWRLNVNALSGTQPERLTALLTDIAGMAMNFRESLFGITCLFSDTAGAQMALSSRAEGVYAARTLRALAEVTFESACGMSGTLTGTFTLTPETIVALAPAPVVTHWIGEALEGAQRLTEPVATEVVFETVNAGGGMSRRRISIRNESDVDLWVQNGWEINGADPDPFTLAGAPAQGTLIPKGEKREVIITYAPFAGEASGTVHRANLKAVTLQKVINVPLRGRVN